MGFCNPDLRTKVRRSGWINGVGFLIYAIVCAVLIVSISDQFEKNLAEQNDGEKVPVRGIIGIFLAVFVFFSICSVGVIIAEKKERPQLLLPYLFGCGILIIAVLGFVIYFSFLKFVDVSRPRGAIVIIGGIVAIIGIIKDMYNVIQLYWFFTSR